MFSEISRINLKNIQLINMARKCKLSICPKLSCSLAYAVKICWCPTLNNKNGVKRIILINLNDGDFLIDEKEQWNFKSKAGHMWEVKKFPEKFREGEEVTESGMKIISSDVSFHDNPIDEICSTRIVLKKKKVVSGKQYITVRVLDNSKDPTNKQSEKNSIL